MLAPNSPFNRIPANLEARQRGWLEGLGFSIEIADLAMNRLADGLLNLMPLEGPSNLELRAAVIADAWTFLDAAWRLKRFLVDSRFPRAPGPPVEAKPAPEYTARAFGEAVSGIKSIRDGYQHLDNYAASLANEGEMVWGHISWATSPGDGKRFRVHSLTASMATPGQPPKQLVAPTSLPTAPISDITLFAFGKSVNLSVIHTAIAEAAASFEAALSPQFEGMIGLGLQSYLVTLDLERAVP